MKTTETRCVPQRVIAEVNEQISKVLSEISRDQAAEANRMLSMPNMILLQRMIMEYTMA